MTRSSQRACVELTYMPFCAFLCHTRFVFCRLIVSCPQDEQSSKSRSADHELDERASAWKARETLARMVCLFAEQAADRDAALASSSSRASKRKSAKVNTPHEPPPFAKTVWFARVGKAQTRARAWIEGRPIEGIHQPHCDAVSGPVLLSVLLVFLPLILG